MNSTTDITMREKAMQNFRSAIINLQNTLQQIKNQNEQKTS